MITAQQKKQKKQYLDYNSSEIFKEFGTAVTNTSKDFLREAADQILGTTPVDMEPGQEVNLSGMKKQQKEIEKKNENIRPAMDYVGDLLRSSEKKAYETSSQISDQVQQIILELKQLASATKVLEQQVLQATGQTLVKPGKYHQTFFQSLLSFVHGMRVQVESSGAWLSTMQKKTKGNNYWGKVKQHGTNFMLSGERSLATQTG